jgi:hypothetical protein
MIDENVNNSLLDRLESTNKFISVCSADNQLLTEKIAEVRGKISRLEIYKSTHSLVSVKTDLNKLLEDHKLFSATIKKINQNAIKSALITNDLSIKLEMEEKEHQELELLEKKLLKDLYYTNNSIEELKILTLEAQKKLISLKNCKNEAVYLYNSTQELIKTLSEGKEDLVSKKNILIEKKVELAQKKTFLNDIQGSIDLVEKSLDLLKKKHESILMNPIHELPDSDSKQPFQDTENIRTLNDFKFLQLSEIEIPYEPTGEYEEDKYSSDIQ